MKLMKSVCVVTPITAYMVLFMALPHLQTVQGQTNWGQTHLNTSTGYVFPPACIGDTGVYTNNCQMPWKFAIILPDEGNTNSGNFWMYPYNQNGTTRFFDPTGKPYVEGYDLSVTNFIDPSGAVWVLESSTNNGISWSTEFYRKKGWISANTDGSPANYVEYISDTRGNRLATNNGAWYSVTINTVDRSWRLPKVQSGEKRIFRLRQVPDDGAYNRMLAIAQAPHPQQANPWCAVLIALGLVLSLVLGGYIMERVLVWFNTLPVREYNEAPPEWANA